MDDDSDSDFTIPCVLEAAYLDVMRNREQPRANALTSMGAVPQQLKTAARPSDVMFDEEDDAQENCGQMDEEELWILQNLSPADGSNAFSLVGKQTCKRKPMPKKYEDKLQAHINKLRAQVERRILKYTTDRNDKKLRKYQRELWALDGM